jgi:hypothetical protein
MSKRLNPNLVKIHRTYSVFELALRLGVHKNTVRHWESHGLTPIDRTRPLLFDGTAVRTFLSKRNAGRRQPCRPGTFYCLRCRCPRPPALGMVEYTEHHPGIGNLRAFCEACEAIMHRRVRQCSIEKVMPGIAVQMAEADPRLSGSRGGSLNCDEKPERSE